MVLSHICVAVDTTADVGLVCWAVANVLRHQDELHIVKACLLHTLHAICCRGNEYCTLLAFLSRRIRRGFTLRVCPSLIASSMSVTRRPAGTRRRRSCTQLGRPLCCSGFAPHAASSAARIFANRPEPCNICCHGRCSQMLILTYCCLHQVREQRVFTSVLPTHMAAPSAGASIVAFADTGFFRLLVVGLHSSNMITRLANGARHNCAVHLP